MPFHTSYGTSKFALEGFFGIVRQELIMAKVDVSITMCTLSLICKSSEKIPKVLIFCVENLQTDLFHAETQESVQGVQF